jgi:hypothetical protein
MNIIITKTFEKNLKKLWSITLKDIDREILKYLSGIGDTLLLHERPGGQILKSYFLGKRVRGVIFFEKVGNNFIPIWVWCKESKIGYNITREDSDYFWKYIEQNDRSGHPTRAVSNQENRSGKIELKL